MDPDKNLQEQLALAYKLLEAGGGEEYGTFDGPALAELVVALDEWLCKGGFLPGRWQGRP